MPPSPPSLIHPLLFLPCLPPALVLLDWSWQGCWWKGIMRMVRWGWYCMDFLWWCAAFPLSCSLQKWLPFSGIFAILWANVFFLAISVMMWHLLEPPLLLYYQQPSHKTGTRSFCNMEKGEKKNTNILTKVGIPISAAWKNIRRIANAVIHNSSLMICCFPVLATSDVRIFSCPAEWGEQLGWSFGPPILQIHPRQLFLVRCPTLGRAQPTLRGVENAPPSVLLSPFQCPSVSPCWTPPVTSWITTFHPRHPPRLRIAAGWHNITDRKPPYIQPSDTFNPSSLHTFSPSAKTFRVRTSHRFNWSQWSAAFNQSLSFFHSCAFHLSPHSLFWMQIKDLSTTLAFCVRILKSWTLCQFSCGWKSKSHSCWFKSMPSSICNISPRSLMTIS